MKKKLIAACILLVLLAYACFKKELDRDPRTNLSYLAWKSGLINFNIDKHRFVFVRDSELIQKLYGTSLKEFTSRHEITLYDGQNFPTSSYRGRRQEAHLARNPALSFFWFNENVDDFGWVFVVKDGKVMMLYYLKG